MATYGRSVFSMVLGLFSSRWVLNGLGKDDFGLFGVVGGLIVFVGLLNGLLATSVARYYAFAIGEAKNQSEDVARENLMRWFNSAISIHWILPVVLVTVGYPVGTYAIQHWLVIPEGRMSACLWVYRFSLFTAFLNMVSVPYIAMYRAKQLIAELSIWEIVTTVSHFGIAYYMLSCSHDRFIAYACLSAVVPSIILAIQIYRARQQFGVCHLRFRYLFDLGRLSKMFQYAFWDFFGWFGATVRDQGSVLVVNRYFGSGMNAAYSIAQNIIRHTTALSSSITGAFQPAITTVVGRGEIEEARRLSFRACKFSALMTLLFAIPVCVEADELLRLWLINPPEFTSGFCRLILLSTVILNLGWGHHMAVCAVGRIARLQIVLGGTACLSLGVLLLFIAMGIGPLSVGYMLIAVCSVMLVERMLFAKSIMGMSIRHWVFFVFIPIVFVAVLSGAASLWFSHSFPPSFWRVCGTSIVSVSVLGAVSLLFVLDRQERVHLFAALRNRFGLNKS